MLVEKLKNMMKCYIEKLKSYLKIEKLVEKFKNKMTIWKVI